MSEICILFLEWGFVAGRRARDEKLAQRLREKDPSALATLYDQHGRAAYSAALRVVRDAAVAEDVVQETFFQIWNKSSLYDPNRGTLGALVIRAARNRAIDYLRSGAGRMSARTTDLCGTEAFPDCGDAISNLDARRRVEAAFQKLNSKQRAVIHLAYYEGMSQSEMASHLNQPLGTVKTLVRSALRILRQELVSDSLGPLP